ncbi:MAG: 4'-phosphopantetheinyl transferase superfamily protein [Pseudomonadales bacterium]
MCKSSYDLEQGRIDIWRIDLNSPGSSDASVLDDTHLSEDELLRAGKFVFPIDRNTFARSRSALRIILSRYLECTAADIVFQYNEQGRPSLTGDQFGQIAFNLSHIRELALIAVTTNCKIGVDLIRLHQDNGRALDWIPIARRSFSRDEQRHLFNLPKENQEPMFHRIWGQKEAYTKAIGEGFQYGFQKFSVAVNGAGETALISDDVNPQSIVRWTLTEIDAGDEYLAIVAHDGAPTTTIRQLQF